MADDALTRDVAKRERFAQRRKALGMTQEALAGLLSVERSTVVRWERGESAPLPWIRPKLAKALRVTADQLGDLLASGSTAASDRPEGAGPTVARQLPAAVANFTGRAVELQTLTRILDRAGVGAPGTVVINAIGGTAGVGKTALALHWAHQVADRFGDGQLYVNLRGFDPVGTPATPAEAIRGFLDALGVPPERIPPLPDAQVDLYRSLAAGRRILIVLDNARDEAQVRPLLPASAASLVIVTSRNQLAGLAATNGARMLTLDVLTRAEAAELLTARIGPTRAAAEPSVITEIAGLCGYLPLALAVAAARAHARPGFALATLADELRDAAGRLDALDAGDPAASVRTVFSWSYAQLAPATARVFRLLGLHPGPGISVPATASLAGIQVSEAGRQLSELAGAHLVTEHSPRRYALHDLLRAYATEQAEATDDEADRHTAIGRVLDHYLHTAHTADLLLQPSHEPINLAPARSGVTPERLAGWEEATAWFEDEHHVLVAATALAAGTWFDVHAWQIPSTMLTFLDRRGRWAELAPLLRTAVAATVRLGDTAGQAISCRLLASICTSLAEYDEARTHLAASLTLCQQLGDRASEARAHMTVGWLAERQGRYADALGHVEQALRLFQAIGHGAGQADALNAIGWCHAQLGSYEQARAFCRRALALHRQAGDRAGEAAAWSSLGYAERHLGHLARAAGYYSRAVSLCQELGDRGAEADTLGGLGDTHQAAGDVPQAQDAWRQALDILKDLDHPDAGKVRAKLGE